MRVSMAMQSSIQPSSSSASAKVGSSSTLGGGGRVMTGGPTVKKPGIFLGSPAKQDFGRTSGWIRAARARRPHSSPTPIGRAPAQRSRSGRRSPIPTAHPIE